MIGSPKSARTPPPFSPVLLVGMAVRPLPLAFLQPVLSMAISLVWRRHPEVFERLEGLDQPVFLIDPTDVPFCVVLRPDPQAPSLVAVRTVNEAEDVTAVIRGPLLALIQLLEGRTDGDALFFTRELVIEGDTEAVVALRNAVDGAEIELLDDLTSVLGPLAGAVRRIANDALSVLTRASQDFETLRAALIAPAMRRSEAQNNRLERLDRKFEQFSRTNRRSKPVRQSAPNPTGNELQ